MIEGEDGDCKKVFRQQPYSTWDDYFSGNRIMNWVGTEGFGGVITCKRDLLPENIPGKYLHEKKTDISD
eukprot:2660492-Ditylum_brightwellii.AAC.1